MHASVADDDDLVDPLREHSGLAADLLDVLVQEADDPGVELSQIAGVELREGDARHEVAAEDRLGIEARDRRELLARLELDQRRHHAGRADVDREAELHPGGVSALDRKDPLPATPAPPDTNVATVTPAGSARRACGNPLSTAGPTSAGARPAASRS